MASVCFYFQVHQPYRLRHYTIFDNDANYFDEYKNAQVCRKVAGKCYLPTNRLMLDLIRRHEGRFKIAYSVTGVLLEQFKEYAPEVLASFQELAETGCVEFLAETYYHSLSFLFSPKEFAAQIDAHKKAVWDLFGQKPRIFRNTELVYNNALAETIERHRRLRRDPGRGRRPHPGMAQSQFRLSAPEHATPQAAAEELSAQRRHRLPVLQPGLARMAAAGREVRPMGQRRQRQRLHGQSLRGLRDLRRTPVGGHRHLRVPPSPARGDPEEPGQRLQDAQRGGGRL